MTTTTSKPPSYYVYVVIKRAGTDKGNWTQIGAAWTNADGKGFNIKLNLVPLNGADIVMRQTDDTCLPVDGSWPEAEGDLPPDGSA